MQQKIVQNSEFCEFENSFLIGDTLLDKKQKSHKIFDFEGYIRLRNFAYSALHRVWQNAFLCKMVLKRDANL